MQTHIHDHAHTYTCKYSQTNLWCKCNEHMTKNLNFMGRLGGYAVLWVVLYENAV
jgi:hypothetical protein